MKKFAAALLSFSLLCSLSTPLTVYAAGGGEAQAAAQRGAYSLSNENICVYVSTENGGFDIRTVEGNKLKKSDNNKKLLYHNGEYDTSFTSFQVERSGETKEYIFGGSYGFLGLDSSAVEVRQLENSIVSEWTVDGIRFTQTIELPNTTSLQHGMVAISYKAEVVSGAPAAIRSRILFDTQLGERDYAYYHFNDSVGYATVCQKETALLGTSYTTGYVPESIYGADNEGLSGVAAYSVNTSAYKAVFAHWNNLASTVFDYTPDPSMTFTNAQNVDYATADSAYALYNDLGTVPTGGSANFSCYYGVYSNYQVDLSDSVAFNLIAPMSLTLSEDKKGYLPTGGAKGQASFGVNVSMTNAAETELKKIAIAAYGTNGIVPLNMDGTPTDFTPSGMEPYYVTYDHFTPGAVQDFLFQFRADVNDAATFRKVELRAYDISDGTTTFSTANLIGIKSFNILCPGGDGNLPQVAFTGADPDILYYKGGNRYIITGTNFSMLTDTSHYDLSLVSDDGQHSYPLDHRDIVIDQEAGTMTLLLGGVYDVGSYHVYINWKQSAYDTNLIPADTPSSYTSDALRLVFTENEDYRNDIYGIVAVVQDTSPAPDQKYTIRSFKDEAALADYKLNHRAEFSEILLELRGRFEAKTDGAGHDIHLTGTARNGANEVITINQCIDFQDGILEVYYQDDDPSKGIINVDFDGSLYTSGERTHIASMPAALTAIKNGQEFDLMEYNLNGQRQPRENVNYINLVWANDGLQMLQNIAGSVFQLGFGTLGEFREKGQSLGKTLSFTAGFDLLGVLLPKGYKYKDGTKPLDRIKNAFSEYDERTGHYYAYSSNSLRDRAANLFSKDLKLTNDEIEANSLYKPDVQILVEDVLFAHVPAQTPGDKELCGFYGFHVNTDILLPQYTTAMPQILARVDINTIRNYNFAVDGSLKFSNMEFGVSLEVLSKENTVPVLNKIFIFCNIPNGPGLFVDPAGVVRITGGGGGFDNIYETLICTDKLPTLQVLLRLYLNVMGVMTCHADAHFSLQGIGIAMKDMRLLSMPTMPPVIPYAGLELQWLPSWYFHIAVSASILQVVNGGGYIVVDQKDNKDVFFEAFLHASISVPPYVGLVGGIEVGGANLGFNSDKLWGALHALGLSFGIVYYWGDSDSFDFGSGAGSVQPTYPELLGLEPVLLGYDEQVGQNLYMKVGTNVSPGATAELVDDLNASPTLMGTASVQSSADRKTHRVVTESTAKQMLTLVYPAGSLEEARTLYGKMTGLSDGIILYDGANLETANANLTFNEELGVATLAITANSPSYNFTTPVSTDVTLLTVAGMPEVDSLQASLNGDRVTITYDGTKLDELDEVSFYLAEEQHISEAGDNSGMFLGSLTDSSAIQSKSVTLPVPKTLQTGSYYVRAVYTQENIINDYAVTDRASITYTNADQPDQPVIRSCENAGDAHLAAVLQDIPANVDGYLVSVYNADGSATDFTGIRIDKDQVRAGNCLLVGGSYTVPDPQVDEQGELIRQNGRVANAGEKKIGLEPGKQYKLGISAYRQAGDDQIGYLAVSREAFTSLVTLAAPTKANVQISSDRPGTLYNSGNVTVTVTSDEALTGTWSLDDGYAAERAGHFGSFTGSSSITIPFRDLKDNSYTLELWGIDATGDTFGQKYEFTVDTTAPRLMISSPISGSLFDETGKLTVTGITDLDAYITITSDGQVMKDHVPFRQLGARLDDNGCFSLDLALDQSISTHDLTITASDEAGNSCTYQAKINHRGLSKIDHVDVYLNGAQYSAQHINTQNGPVTGQLSMVAVTENGERFTIRDDIVHWNVQTTEGKASVTENGSVSFGQSSEGFIVGMFNITSVAPMTASASFGTMENTGGISVVTGSSVGGSVTGGGVYHPGETVTLTATADSGYVFSHWTVQGVTVPNLKQATIQFTMPGSPVEAVAHFSSVNGGGGSGSGGSGSGGKVPDKVPGILAEVEAKQGEKVVEIIKAPVGDPDGVVAQYSTNGGKTYRTVALSQYKDGTITFLAPADATYRIVSIAPAQFTDTVSHWSRPYVAFTAARGIVNGVGGGSFAPDSRLTRSMFVTMLGRMHGDVGGAPGNSFTDTVKNSWYDQYVSWASHNGIVNGYGDHRFGPDNMVTREEICVMLYRYLKWIGYPEAETAAADFTDREQISDWALEAVTQVQALGLVNGYANGSFAPQGLATRGESATIFTRLIHLLLQ